MALRNGAPQKVLYWWLNLLNTCHSLLRSAPLGIEPPYEVHHLSLIHEKHNEVKQCTEDGTQILLQVLTLSASLCCLTLGGCLNSDAMAERAWRKYFICEWITTRKINLFINISEKLPWRKPCLSVLVLVLKLKKRSKMFWWNKFSSDWQTIFKELFIFC